MAAHYSMINRKALFILATLLIVVTVIKAQNMFQFPYYQDIEGTTLANGWSAMTEGRFSPYTYAYEEPPLGAMLISVWLNLTGGTNTYGFPINSGRVLMLVLHIISCGLVYGITRKVTRSDICATISTVIFAFSPLVTVLQRRVLVDNVMIVLMLGALYLVLGDHRRLYHYILSAVFFGLGVLTKGSSLFFAPAFIIILRSRSDRHHRRFAIALWTALLFFLVILYPMYAQMKQELFPQGWLLGGDFPHVSLWERLSDRGPETGRLLNIGSGLSQSFNTWTNLENIGADPVLMYGGIVCAIFVLLIAIDNQIVRPIIVFNVMLVLYLFLGGFIYDSAAIYLLPILAVNVGIVVGGFGKLLGSASKNRMFRIAMAGVAALILLYPFWVFYSSRLDIYMANQVKGQIDAVEWVKRYVAPDALLVTDNYAFVELRGTMPNAHYYWKVDTDPAVKFNILNDNVCNIDYMITTPQVFADIDIYKMSLMERAYRQSQVLQSFPNNGWPVEVRQVNKVNCAPQAVGMNDGQAATTTSTAPGQ